MGKTQLISVLAVAAALAVVAAAAGAPPDAASACKKGVVDRIGKKVVCIHVGGKCRASHNARYRAHGYTCVSGRLRRSRPAPPPTPPPPPPPPPPPAPPAAPGHYEGMTSQNEIIKLDVQGDGVSVTGFSIHTINRSCNPGGGWYGPFDLMGVIRVASDGTLALDVPYTFAFSDGTTGTGHFVLHGSFGGATLSGSFTDTSSFTDQGIGFTCSSSVVTFSANHQ